jgi:hypothetical protein
MESKTSNPTVTDLLSEHQWDNVKDFDGNVQKLLLMYWQEIQKLKETINEQTTLIESCRRTVR